MKKFSAFTLIELLVVIVIIAILAGIAMPVFSKVLEKGRVTQDGSNLRQIGIGTVAYLNDHDDTLFSLNTTGTSVSSKTLKPPGLLQINYVPNPKVFQSPFDKRPPGGSANPDRYGLNSNLFTITEAHPPWDRNVTKLVPANQLIMYAPSYPGGNGDPTAIASWTGTDESGLGLPAGGTGMTKGTHQNNQWISALYADSHVGNVKFTVFQTTTDTSTGSAGGVDGLNQWQPMGHPAAGGP